jgi:tetratricopeptide (TPR) repeat protein
MIRRAWPLLLALLAAPCTAQSSPGLEALIVSGRLAELEALARAGGDSTAVRLADILVLRGRPAVADSIYWRIRTARGPDWRAATAGAAEIAARRGDRGEVLLLAGELADAWRSRDDTWSVHDHVAAGRAFLLLADGEPDAVRTALAAFDAASAADPESVEGSLRAADLFLDRYNAPDARAGYQGVLAIRPDDPRALIGLARAAAFDRQGDAMTPLRQALARNPTSVPGNLLLARLHLEAEQYDSSRTAAERALAVDSSSTEAWAAVGALAWLRGDRTTWRRAEQATAGVYGRPAMFYAAVADAAARHRRYAEAVDLARRGVGHDSSSVPALGALGNNLLRTGAMAEGRAMLERAFVLDPFHLWHKNTLDLLDHMAGFRTVERGRFQIVAPERDAEFLATLLVPLLEEAYDSLASRYEYRPPPPIRVELYDRHADFSVRTIGLTGLGALGVAFGTVLVLDAPQARPGGEFNLGSTAWHELAHTFTLGASGHRVPRWLSEGLSVLEERRARPGWGAHASVGFVQALAADDLLPIASLNDGFVRPDRPERIGLSYYQSSLVVEFLEREYGIEGIRAMLRGYAHGEDTDQVLRAVSGVPTDSLQRRFDAWVDDRFARPVEAIVKDDPAVFGEQLNVAAEALQAGDTTAALRVLAAARDRFPEHGGAGGPRFPLAIALWRTGDRAGALREVAVVTASDETALMPNRLEATWALETADTARALGALRRATWIAPNAGELWIQRAEVAAALGAHADAVLSRRAVVALRPSDPIAARTDLAEALLRSGDASAARRELLGVLEQAPSYERAQGLLLEARRSGATP